MKNLPSWIPYPGSWMNAIFLNLLMGVLAFSVKFTQHIGHFLAQNGSLRLGWSFGVLAILSPILVIAVAHHLLHIFLDRFFPNSPSSEISKTEGFFPGILSWWEGLYGWLTIVLSVLIGIAIITAFLPTDASGYALLRYMQMLFSWDHPEHILSAPIIGRIIIAAYFYQFEHLVRCRLSYVSSTAHFRR